MKRYIATLVALTLFVAAFAFSAAASEVVSKAEEEERDYVRFTATGNDPYANFEFTSTGNNSEIDPDIVKWASIRYRVNNPTDTTGVNYTGQFYALPEAEPCVPIIWDVSEGWHTIVVDLTSVSKSTTLESIWNSGDYTRTNAIRFDPLEPDRDAELNQEGQGGAVAAGDSIDVAWMGFFEIKNFNFLGLSK